MAFTIRNGQYSFSVPLPPQHFTINPVPRKHIQDTLGGRVIQLLGWSVSATFSGYVHNRMVDRSSAWADMYAFRQFMSKLMLNQREGIQSHVEWDEMKFSMDCFLGDFSISESIDKLGFDWSISLDSVSKAGLKSAGQVSQMLSMLKQQVGFTAGAEGYHGGDGDGSLIHQYTGFTADGPSASSPSSSSAKLSDNADIKQVQEYAKSRMKDYGWTDADFQALLQMWERESGWNYKAENPSSGAYGIPQMNPLGGHPIAMEASYRNSAQKQVDVGLDYIRARYGSPSAAWKFWQAHNYY